MKKNVKLGLLAFGLAGLLLGLPFLVLLLAAGGKGGGVGGGMFGGGKSERVDSDELCRLYHSNEAAADARFKGRTLETTARVHMATRAFAILYGLEESHGTEIKVPLPTRDLAALEAGGVVTVRGYCEGYRAEETGIPFDVVFKRKVIVLSSATLVRKEKP